MTLYDLDLITQLGYAGIPAPEPFSQTITTHDHLNRWPGHERPDGLKGIPPLGLVHFKIKLLLSWFLTKALIVCTF